jgi:hypothetical protein
VPATALAVFGRLPPVLPAVRPAVPVVVVFVSHDVNSL